MDRYIRLMKFCLPNVEEVNHVVLPLFPPRSTPHNSVFDH